MKLAIIGYGKMGKTIEKVALSRGISIPLIIDETPSAEALKDIDVAIEFSHPDAAVNNIKICLDNQVKIVSGTTGWLDRFEEMKAYCTQKEGGFIYASNYSVGVNIFFKLNTILAQMMQNHLGEYKVNMEEIHHNQKLDAPSGTAISLAEQIINQTQLNAWHLGHDNTPTNSIPIQAKRVGVIPGTHSVSYDSIIDSIEIKHTAHTREGFALGAVLAAEWLMNKKGNFDMQDVLNLK